MRPQIAPGATFPDYELPDQTGKRRRLSELQGSDPLILVLSRGHFCPKDRRQLRNLVELYPEIKVAYTKVVTISTDNLLETKRDARRARRGVAAPVRSRPGRPEGSRHRRVLRPPPRPDDPVHVRAGARDIRTPGLREKWEGGERDDFWPYGRSMREVLAAREG